MAAAARPVRHQLEWSFVHSSKPPEYAYISFTRVPGWKFPSNVGHDLNCTVIYNCVSTKVEVRIWRVLSMKCFQSRDSCWCYSRPECVK
ncbi:hypothetical protein I7I53_08631 [Histoplasma capsulatum var. duboisii H88]|uniref:Uncharacterized protein n=1 Tax=Ajellomyces capsulatus (strain H88) TaxID=544711 RepID=A0A8A1LJQ3_AJEC8|nr:hypothetical protein I7I53_08631 [Histoplasma capsulatum var. duboisii H88]